MAGGSQMENDDSGGGDGTDGGEIGKRRYMHRKEERGYTGSLSSAWENKKRRKEEDSMQINKYKWSLVISHVHHQHCFQ